MGAGALPGLAAVGLAAAGAGLLLGGGPRAGGGGRMRARAGGGLLLLACVAAAVAARRWLTGGGAGVAPASDVREWTAGWALEGSGGAPPMGLASDSGDSVDAGETGDGDPGDDESSGGSGGEAPADPCAAAGTVTEACRGTAAGAGSGAGAEGSTPQGSQRDRTGKYMEWAPTHANYALDKELVEHVAKNGTVLVTWANFHYLDFTESWVAHVRALNITNYLVGAMDEKMFRALHERGIHTFSMGGDTQTTDFGWGSEAFHKMGQEKVRLVQAFLKMGYAVFVCDVDTAIMRDPFPFFARYPEADILFSSDAVIEHAPDGEALADPAAVSHVGNKNIGIMFFRPGTASLDFVNEWVVLVSDTSVWDQSAFNDLLMIQFRTSLGQVKEVRSADHARDEEAPPGLWWGYDHSLLLGELPVSTFASGHTFYVQRMFERVNAEPYIVHNTFQYSGTPGKRHRFREALLWMADTPDYYDPPGGLLTYDMEIPEELLRHASGTAYDRQSDAMQSLLYGGFKLTLTKEIAAGHFRLVNWQLTRLRNAAGVAAALGRVLVVPEFYCGLDRFWGPHNGITPGSGLKTPFICPLDHVLDLEVMENMNSDRDVYGPPVLFRESSFFDNSRVPAAVKDSEVSVRICDGPEDCDASTGAAIPRFLKSEDLKEALRPWESEKVLRFADATDIFGGFTDVHDQEKFEHRVRLMGSIWCCVQPEEENKPGHIWYDLWWDTPHTDRHDRDFFSEWFPGHWWFPLLGP